MALLNYSVPAFPNIPTPMPFFHQNPQQQLYPPVPNLGHNIPYNSYLPVKQKHYNPVPPQQFGYNNVPQQQPQQQFKDNVPTPSVDLSPGNTNSDDDGIIPPLLTEQQLLEQQQKYPQRPIEYKRIDPNKQKTSIHPIIDYDNDYEYYDDDTGQPAKPKGHPHVTPIQGPIFVKNNSVPVVPLYSYPLLNNGTFVQIPILWTALSIALGWELKGEIIRGVPCIKRYHQLFCPTAGNSYPIDRIELFIDENKALMKRMYGDFEMNPESNPASSTSRTNKRATRSTKHHHPHKESNNKTAPGWVSDLYSDPIPDPLTSRGFSDDEPGGSYFAKMRKSRQSSRPPTSSIPNFRQSNDSGRMDVCESKIELLTPYWASNAVGKVRAIVNTQHFEQAIHQEICSKTSTSRCTNDCGCEQKYKWHRLLAYDPDDDCKGIFMDWFLFPSCCVCRCSPS